MKRRQPLTLTQFLEAERRALQRFMNRHADADFAGATAAYSRVYSCPCGVMTADPRAIFNHAQAGCQPALPTLLGAARALVAGRSGGAAPAARPGEC